MNDIEIMELEKAMEELWPKMTDGQMGVITRKAKGYELGQALRILSAAAEKKMFPADLVPKLCAAFGGKSKCHSTMPVYALSASGKHYTEYFEVNDHEHAKNAMRKKLERVTALYGWTDLVSDFDLYVGEENHAAFNSARGAINDSKPPASAIDGEEGAGSAMPAPIINPCADLLQAKELKSTEPDRGASDVSAPVTRAAKLERANQFIKTGR